MTLFANRISSRFLSVLAAHKLLLCFVIGAAVFGQPGGCSRRPDLAGVYFLPSNSSDSQWSTDSILKLREDGTAMVEGITFHTAAGSKMYSEVATRGKGKWWAEGNNVIYEGTIETASTLEDKDHQGREPMRLVFTIASNGDLLLLSKDTDSDSVRYIRER